MSYCSRRTFLCRSAAASLASFAASRRTLADPSKSPFKVAVISDEISPDFDHACHVVSQEFGLSWIELRSMWGKSLMDLPMDQIDEAQKILARYNLQVTDIASPLFKTDWPGAPRSPYGSRGDLHGAAEATFQQQDEILQKSIALAKAFKTDKVRCFDFWRIDDVAPYRSAIDEKLRSAAETAGKQGILLVLENEFECNTATGREAHATLNAIQTPHLALNWDPATPSCVVNSMHSRRLGHASEEPHSSLPLQECDQERRRQNRLGSGRQGLHRLDGSIQGPQTGRLRRCGQPGDTLAWRRHARGVHAGQLGGDEASADQRGSALEAAGKQFYNGFALRSPIGGEANATG